jgi:antitoxin Phd
MKVYSYSEARQRFAEVLRQAGREGQVQIRRRDGQLFVVQPAHASGSPLDVPAVDGRLTRTEIVGLVRESRRSTERLIRRRPATMRVPLSKARRKSGAKRTARTRLRG